MNVPIPPDTILESEVMCEGIFERSDTKSFLSLLSWVWD